MKLAVLLGAVAVLSGLASASSRAQGAAARVPQNEPGKPTVANVFVLNHDRGDAVPVTVHSTGDVLPVAIASMPAVVLAADTAVTARAGRQRWEYRELARPASGDAVETLNEAGMDGWEAVGATAVGGRTVWLLKRPR